MVDTNAAVRVEERLANAQDQRRVEAEMEIRHLLSRRLDLDVRASI